MGSFRQSASAGNMHHRLLIAALLTLVVGGATPGVAADGAAAVSGRWSGPVAAANGAAVSGLGTSLTLVVAPEDDGFHVTITSGQPFLDADFSPDGHPGVYEVSTRGPGSIFSLFTKSRAADPLTGAPLVWARTTPQGLVLYRLDLDSGAFHLDRVAMVRKGDGIEVTISVRRHEQPVARASATLARQGG
jgi:hypothetical protein